MKIRKNILHGPTGNRQATLSNDQVRDETILPCDILIRSVGYVGDKLEPNLVPSDKNGTIVHDGLGRVRYNEDSSASATGRLYVCGWAKRGASGVIATNVQCAEETAEAIKEDILNGLLKPAARILPPPPSNTITASKWFKLDAVERGENGNREETEEEDVEEKSESNKTRVLIIIVIIAYRARFHSIFASFFLCRIGQNACIFLVIINDTTNTA